MGLLLCGRVKEQYTKTIMVCLGLCTLILGVRGALGTEDILLVIISLALGTALGELMKIEQGLDRLGTWLKGKVAKNSGGRFTEGFVTASLLFCVGSMAILGSLDAGLRGEFDVIYTKSVLDGIMAVIFGATMGVGVVFSSIVVLVYQGALTLLAGVIEPLLTPEMMRELTAVGGIMLIATGINVSGISKEHIRVGNMLPALVIPVIWYLLSK